MQKAWAEMMMMIMMFFVLFDFYSLENKDGHTISYVGQYFRTKYEYTYKGHI